MLRDAGNTLPSRRENEVSPRRASLGFTLLELMIAVSIAGVLLMVGLPGLSEVVRNMQAKNAAFELIADLTLARSEAIRRNATVEVSPSAGGWADGWEVTQGSTAIKTRAAVSTNVVMTTAEAATAVAFDATGRLDGTAPAIEVDTINGEYSRCIRMTPSGATRVDKGACP